jgi:hypothetical protein
MDLDLKQIFNKNLLLLIGGFLVLEILSVTAFYVGFLSWPIFIILVGTVGVLTWLKTEYGAYILIVDLIMSGLGSWFFLDIGDFRLPIRLAIFASVMLIWLIKLIIKLQEKAELKEKFNLIKKLFFNDPKVILLLFFSVFFVLAVSIGLIYGRGLKAIFQDSNNYLYLLAILLFLSVKIDVNKLLVVFFAGTYALAIKTGMTLTSLAYASGTFNSYLYKWIRDTRIGEMTAIFPPLYRVFFQSHLYNLSALLIIITILFLTRTSTKHKVILGLSAWLNFWVVLISGSRSFWLAMFFSCGLLFLYLIIDNFNNFISLKFYKRALFTLKQPLILGLFLFSCLVAGQFFTNIILNDYQVSLLFSRVSTDHNISEGGNEAGVNSRRDQFLPLTSEIKKSPLWGRGFAKTVTYFNSDPRINGNYTTSAFELAYLDMWLKFGILGLFFYLFFIFEVATETFSASNSRKYLYFGVLIIFALLLINVFTPYLNHPLGIGLILMIVGLTGKKPTNNLGSAS